MSESFEKRLRRLPSRRAPSSLSPRILAAAALYARPWHERPFWTWSAPARAAFAAAVALGAFSLLRLGAPLAAEASVLAARAWTLVEPVAPIAKALNRLLWSARLPLAALGALAAAPAAALAGLAAARAGYSRRKS